MTRGHDPQDDIGEGVWIGPLLALSAVMLGGLAWVVHAACCWVGSLIF